MNKFDTLFGLYLLGLFAAVVGCNVTEKRINSKCPSTQYIELGKEGIINCVLEDFYSVIWYTDVDFNTGTPTIRLQNSIISGTGHESGEFGMQINGALIIYEVELQHEQMYTVAFAKSDNDLYDIIKVRTILLVKPDVPFPIIDQCDNVCDKCYAEVMEPTIQCSVRGIRPNITLAILSRTVYGDREIPNHNTVTSDGAGQTYIVTTSDVFIHTHLSTVLVCKASSLPELLEKSESTVLVLNNVTNVNVTSKHLNIILNTKMQLRCANHEIGYGVWKKKSSLNSLDLDLLLYSVLINETFTEILDDEFTVGDNISLLIQRIQVHHEGIYICIFGDGVEEGVTAYSVDVTVPSSPYIKGCNQQHNCEIEARYDGNITCTVKGIRPKVELQWRTLPKVQKHISFKNNRLTFVENDDTFDVSLDSEYHVRERSLEKITVECEMITLGRKLPNASAKMDLIFNTVGITITDRTNNSLLGIVLALVILCLILVLCGVILLRRVCKGGSLTGDVENKEEMTPLSGQCQSELNTIAGMTRIFLKQLREKYKDLYNAIQPIPYIKDKMYCVDNIFVEGGIEYLDAKESNGITAEGQWKSLETYQNMFDNLEDQQTRYILEGEPGYGKSTIALQIAYDWCNCIESSPLRDVNLLILLRLRQLGSVTSVYRAIKQFILPKDSQLSEPDIQDILQKSSSVVIILDGFDEYPDHDSSASDIISIINRQMFQDFKVVLTTRSSFLPKKYSSLTKRVRLSGFDENARRRYLQKAVVGNDSESICKIEGYLEENPILSDLCQVPLLFVIFAHMTYESEGFRKLNSVTSFFRYVISSFHSHMRNKMNDENVNKYELFEKDHRKLDKLAFDALSGQDRRISWDKDEICRFVGHEFCEQYIRIGVLVEEESLDIIDNPKTPITEHVKYKREVRFYHKLFCEWYASHYLSESIKQNPDLDLPKYLQTLDPFDVQYLYRFSCGLNYDSSRKIINYLKNMDGGDKFAILCILEQTGKIEKIIQTIQQLCMEGVIISSLDSLLLQRSSIQLLEIAAKNSIPIETVALYNCFQSVDPSHTVIKTTSGLSLCSSFPVKVLDISLYNREMSADEYIALIQFSATCLSLRHLEFWGSSPPRKLSNKHALSTLYARNVTVKHCGVYRDSSTNCILNLLTGRWEKEKDGVECTEEFFELVNLHFNQVQNKTEEDDRRNVRTAREALRSKAEGKRTDVDMKVNDLE